jgi:hypothetical protein
MNENYELMLGDGGNLYWFPESDNKLALNIGQVEEEYVDVVQRVLKELKRLRGAIADIANNMEAADESYMSGFIEDLRKVIE